MGAFFKQLERQSKLQNYLNYILSNNTGLINNFITEALSGEILDIRSEGTLKK